MTSASERGKSPTRTPARYLSLLAKILGFLDAINRRLYKCFGLIWTVLGYVELRNF
ncbi:hypothetical protein [Nostoc sp. 'Peltigera membranacea cyanobiont' 210A]|uniref:hypothetical protein n=1 Tax=Nostoc sp. 'Peltigera membranacea cyanobiont' 210A TaxID=2014529 RepID=UPI00167D987C|nr:hypothetical protein [Nostoc sp. 'Peltigera membranacea cyanobiont' 210A]